MFLPYIWAAWRGTHFRCPEAIILAFIKARTRRTAWDPRCRSWSISAALHHLGPSFLLPISSYLIYPHNYPGNDSAQKALVCIKDEDHFPLEETRGSRWLFPHKYKVTRRMRRFFMDHFVPFRPFLENSSVIDGPWAMTRHISRQSLNPKLILNSKNNLVLFTYRDLRKVRNSLIFWIFENVAKTQARLQKIYV